MRSSSFLFIRLRFEVTETSSNNNSSNNIVTMSRLIKIISTVLTIFACSCNAYQFLWGLNKELNALCPQKDGASEVSVPNQCDVRNFIMCYNGQAIAINNCAANERFNRQKNACDFVDQVPLPNGCKENDKPSEKKCGQPGVTVEAVEDSCKFYYSCTTSGKEKMRCNP
ncbi:hypothetical protein ElyMa_005400700 [Elysia marginata]|uniref:Chitin-binding type-2 domain-containing protein n=1 Tax=Elysia marginata TaxID=1093978 RepID=A0AAV4EGI1_9GAST|nr:hypothetical protein ElyMa_005400700 [Elysia marginata]